MLRKTKRRLERSQNAEHWCSILMLRSSQQGLNKVLSRAKLGSMKEILF